MSIKGQDHSLTLVKDHSDLKLKLVFLRNSWVIWNQSSYESLWENGNENLYNGLGHMTKMAAMPIYGKKKL